MLNDTPNAFVTNHDEIIITTGLLKYVQTVEALLGVLAHEIGHINNFHLSKRKESIEDIKLIDQIGNLATITSAILSNNPEIMLQSSIINKINIKNYYSSFSKNQEREADLFAIERLNDLKISTKGLEDFLIFLENESYKKGQSEKNYMFSTHPNYEDRLNIISSFKKNYSKKLEKDVYDNFLFIKAKLFAHTQNDINLLNSYVDGDQLKYGKSIIFANQGKLLESLQIINSLIDKSPKNNYFIETKADILLSHGYNNQAKKFYEIALSRNKKNIYIKKRLFNIDYDYLKFDNYNQTDLFFKNYIDLIFYSSRNKNFYKKWLNIFEYLNKDDWYIFAEAKIDIINENYHKAIAKLENIKENSSNNNLVRSSKMLIKQISNE